MTDSELRQAVRRAYNFACGYCSVHEADAGSELELDHFKPRSLDGGDELENLVYCCTTCNRIKGDFGANSTAEKRLLHPQNDDLSLHLRQESDGIFDRFNRNWKVSSETITAQSSAISCLASGAIGKCPFARRIDSIPSYPKKMTEHLQKRDGEIERIYKEISRLLKK